MRQGDVGSNAKECINHTRQCFFMFVTMKVSLFSHVGIFVHLWLYSKVHGNILLEGVKENCLWAPYFGLPHSSNSAPQEVNSPLHSGWPLWQLLGNLCCVTYSVVFHLKQKRQEKRLQACSWSTLGHGSAKNMESVGHVDS